jgi:hypothetical protein
MLDVTKIFINVGNSNPGTDMFNAYVVEALEHVVEQTYLSRIRRRKIRVTAFRSVRDVT